MADVETHDYRCTVTLLLEDVTEDTARKFFQAGAEVEGVQPLDGYLAMIDDAGRIDQVGA